MRNPNEIPAGKDDKPKFGATGEFPDGKIHEDDEGELMMGVAADRKNRQVVVEFGKPVAWMAMSPEQAISLAEILKKQAHACKRKV